MYIHKIFIFTVFLLTGFGLIMLASASGFQSRLLFDSSSYLFSRQAIYGLGIGIIGFFIGYLISPSLLRKLSVPLLFVSIVLLLLVFVPGIGLEYGGSNRWIRFGTFSFQPSEIAKIALLLYASSWLASHKKEITSLTRGLLPFLVLSVPIPLLILLEPNLSDFSIASFIIALLLFISGARISHLLSLGFIGILVLVLALTLVPSRLDRVLTFLNPQVDPQGASYQINQSLIAIGSGGIQGRGLGQGIQKSGFLPEPAGDAIFAVIAEEFGFVGATILIALYLLFVLEGIIISRRVPDVFSQYVVVGFVSLVALQAFINVSAVSGLLPLTGITLPFISYGGTSLAILLGTSGVVAGIAKRSI